MEYISLILSIIAIIISIAVAIFEYLRDYRINTINLESVYFKDIYKDHLVYRLPKAMKYINFNFENELIGTDNLLKALQELRNDSIYFEYNHSEFYNTLKRKIQNLENYLVEKTDKKFSGKEQNEIKIYIKQELANIYKIISDGYLGK